MVTLSANTIAPGASRQAPSTELSRIPLRVHHPDIQGGRRFQDFIRSPAVMAGMRQAAGADMPEPFHAIPFLSILEGLPRDFAVMGRPTESLSMTDGSHTGVLWNRSEEEMKSIFNNGLGWTDEGADELYVLNQDPGETLSYMGIR